MLITAVLDPTAYNQSCFRQAGYRDNAEMFLRGIWTNGLLLVDPNGVLADGLRSEIASLQTADGQEIAIWLEELLKNKRKRIIKCQCQARPNQRELICEVARTTKVDGVISAAASHQILSDSCGLVLNIIELSSYLGSKLERERFRFEQGLQRIDTLPKDEVYDCFRRAMLFSTRIRLYDKQIGKGTNTSHFRNGIKYVLDVWKDSGYFQGRRNDLAVEIITTLKNSEIPSHADNRLAYEKVYRELLEPLRDRYPAWKIELKVKEDPDGIFHRRYLEAQAVIVEIDRGFDLFKPGGKLKRNTLRIENSAYDHLRECRGLREFVLA